MTRRPTYNPARRDAIRAMVLDGIKPRMVAIATGVKAKAISKDAGRIRTGGAR